MGRLELPSGGLLKLIVLQDQGAMEWSNAPGLINTSVVYIYVREPFSTAD